MAAPSWENKGADFSNTSAAPSFVVPAGAASGMVAIVSMFINVAATLVTGVPAGFSAVPGTPVVGGSNSLHKYWKRLTGADSGTYDFTLDSAQFVEGSAELYRNCVLVGNPFDPDPGFAFDDANDTVTPPVTTSSIGPDRLFIHTATDWAGGSWTSPTGYTKRLQPPVGLITISDKVQASAGSSGPLTAVSSNSNKQIAHVVSLIGTTVAGGSMATISDQARINMLTELALVEPQLLSNVDLMRGVVAKVGQLLVPITNKTYAGHYYDYLLVLRG